MELDRVKTDGYLGHRSSSGGTAAPPACLPAGAGGVVSPAGHAAGHVAAAVDCAGSAAQGSSAAAASGGAAAGGCCGDTLVVRIDGEQDVDLDEVGGTHSPLTKRVGISHLMQQQQHHGKGMSVMAW